MNKTSVSARLEMSSFTTAFPLLSPQISHHCFLKQSSDAEFLAQQPAVPRAVSFNASASSRVLAGGFGCHLQTVWGLETWWSTRLECWESQGQLPALWEMAQVGFSGLPGMRNGSAPQHPASPCSAEGRSASHHLLNHYFWGNPNDADLPQSAVL